MKYLCGMIFKKFLPISLLLSVVFVLSSYQLPKNILKKVHKQIKSAFEISDFALLPVLVPAEINRDLPIPIRTANFFAIRKNEQLVGYAFVDKAPSQTAQFDYLVLLNTDLTIQKTKVLIYREEYGSEIASARWLKQFVGKPYTHSFAYKKNIAAISGATVSVRSMTYTVNKVLQTITILHQNKII